MKAQKSMWQSFSTSEIHNPYEEAYMYCLTMKVIDTVHGERNLKKKMWLSLITIQAEALRCFKGVKVKFYDQDSWLVMGGFIDLNCANFCNVKVSGDAASADIKAAV